MFNSSSASCLPSDDSLRSLFKIATSVVVTRKHRPQNHRKPIECKEIYEIQTLLGKYKSKLV